jgi:hypothetical protein
MKIGDRVTVYRKVTKGSIWVEEMDDTVGLSGVIISSYDCNADVKLDSPPVGNYGQWWYPLSSLKHEVTK